MSSIYIQEPPTNGMVCLVTTVGDIEVELWSKECPLACRNFVQLSLERYYDGTEFHRVVPGFIVQGGDPTGTGMGGDSIYGKTFKDEFHSRLKFVRRGLVAMANAGPNDNGSQFFFTLDKTPELQNKHTIFGKVIGNTVYNMLKLAECQVDKNERPENPHKIIRIEVISNPFPDMLPRSKPKSERKKVSSKAEKEQKGTKDFKLLSFGNEAEEEEELYSAINKSINSSKGKSAFDHGSFSKTDSLEVEEPDKLEHPESPSASEQQQSTLERVKDKLRANRKATVDKKEAESVAKRESDNEEQDLNALIEDDKASSEKVRLAQLKEEVKGLKRELKTTKPESTDENASKDDVVTNENLKVYYADMDAYTLKRGKARKTETRESQIYEKLEQFKQKLVTARAARSENQNDKSTASASDEEDIDEAEWLCSRFSEDQNTNKIRDAIDVHTRDAERYTIEDPRNPLNKRRREQKHSRHRDSKHKSRKHSKHDK